MITRKKILANPKEDKVRLYDYLPEIIPEIPSRKGIKKALKKGQFLLNGRKGYSGDWVVKGDTIEWVDLEENPPKAFPLTLKVIQEDAEMAIVYKPAGIEVSGNKYRTIQNALLHTFTLPKLDSMLAWPRPVHRLDAPTSGLLVIAKSRKALLRLGEMFANRQIKKTYHAVIIGKITSSGVWKTEVEEKTALTHYRPLQQVPSLKNQWLTLLELKPESGRKHQLRIHCSKAGFPILGDSVYGKDGLILQKKGLFLSSVGLEFAHPTMQHPMEVCIPAPKKFITRMQNEKRRHLKFHGQ